MGTNTRQLGNLQFEKLSNQIVEWQAVVVADGSTGLTAVSGRGYFINTTAGAITVTLPSSPTIGDTISIRDYAGTFGTNAVTINRNSNNIEGTASNLGYSTNNSVVTLVYVDNTKGWVTTESEAKSATFEPLFIEATGGTISTSGNFKIHSFTGDGNFVVSQLGNAPSNPTGGPTNVDYLVVGGGAAGGRYFSGGGGGAGGHRTTFPSPSCNAGAFPISAQTYPIAVGAGGSSPPGNAAGTQGSNSSFSTITSAGGGGGGSYSGNPIGINRGIPGGSGGGAAGYCATHSATGGTGNTPPVSPSQGNNGGSNSTGAPDYGAGGGGGIGGAGVNGAGTGSGSGNGGAGTANSITGSSVTRAGGGGGGATSTGPSGTGGTGGGANGGEGGGDTGPSATANTGGGGGGGGYSPGGAGYAGAGGKGIVIIRYKFQ